MRSGERFAGADLVVVTSVQNDREQYGKKADGPAVVRKPAEFAAAHYLLQESYRKVSDDGGHDETDQVDRNERPVDAGFESVEEAQYKGAQNGRDREEKGEPHRVVPVEAAGDADGDGGAGAGETGDKGDGLAYAYEKGVQRGHGLFVLLAFLQPCISRYSVLSHCQSPNLELSNRQQLMRQ